jgi:chromosome segregation ATPase
MAKKTSTAPQKLRTQTNKVVSLQNKLKLLRRKEATKGNQLTKLKWDLDAIKAQIAELVREIRSLGGAAS